MIRLHSNWAACREMFRVMRSFIAVLGLSVFLCCAAARSESAPDTRPAATQPATAELIGQLGDPDPQVRSRATRLLWSRGQAILPALKEAAAGDDPEIARRARMILRDFAYGLYPDAPREVFTQLDLYRTGDLNQKRTAVWKLGGQGVPGLRVLLKLREEEKNPNLHQIISQVLSPREHEVAVLMLADGQTEDVEKVLHESAFESATAAQDYTALLLTTGKLPETLARLKAETLTRRNAPLLSALARAAGDLPTARAAAENSDAPDLLDAILTDQAQWASLARRLASNPARMEPSERLGYLCTYYRLAGDDKNFQKTAGELADQAKLTPESYVFCAENLFLNGLPEQGVAILLNHKDYLGASNYLAPRLQLKEAMQLPTLADQQQPAESMNVRARTVEALHFAGETAKAREMMEQVAQENHLRHDLATWATLIGDALELGVPEKADEYCADAAANATRQDPTSWLFQRLRLGDGIQASQWWLFLRDQHKEKSALDTLRQLRSIFDGTIAPRELAKLAEASRQYTLALPPPERESWEQTVADTLARRGLIDQASQWFTRLAQMSANPEVLIRAGDFEASRKNWSAAAENYTRAWEHDRTRAAVMFLKGWAIAQSGRQDEGRALMELAHRLPLGSESSRFDLLETLRRHNLTADAQREADLILTATAPRSFERNQVLRESAEEAAAKGDYITAAGLYERAFLQNLSNSISFSEPWANVVVPALIHKTRALGLIKAGQIDPAIKESKIALQEVPADADALIDLVNALDRSGHKDAADALYQEQTAVYRKLISDYPQSGPGHNQLAWAQVMCHRELDEALKNARRAVELEPTSTASLDTLAEVYFAREDAADAVTQMKRCVELEPGVARHHQQLARFEAALHPTTQPG